MGVQSAPCQYSEARNQEFVQHQCTKSHTDGSTSCWLCTSFP
uniref:Uncharacterized protein n=1 Tax=Arundo donax TaxID=35708 RepID=A0A0A9H5T8_ARUDO